MHWKSLVNIFVPSRVQISLFLRTLMYCFITFDIRWIFWHDPNVKCALRCILWDIWILYSICTQKAHFCAEISTIPSKNFIKKKNENFVPFGCRYWENIYTSINTIYKSKIYFNMIGKLWVKWNLSKNIFWSKIFVFSELIKKIQKCSFCTSIINETFRYLKCL